MWLKIGAALAVLSFIYLIATVSSQNQQIAYMNKIIVDCDQDITEANGVIVASNNEISTLQGIAWSNYVAMGDGIESLTMHDTVDDSDCQ